MLKYVKQKKSLKKKQPIKSQMEEAYEAFATTESCQFWPVHHSVTVLKKILKASCCIGNLRKGVLSYDCKKILPTDWKPKTECSTGCRFAGMGNLIKVLTRDIDHNAAHFFLDFEKWPSDKIIRAEKMKALSFRCPIGYLNMGNLLKVLTCTDLEQGPNFFLDFENAQPTESEKEIYNQVNVVLKDAEGILEDLQSYRGAGHEIREAIQHPNDEKLQEKAWGAVVPLVGKLKKFYEFSQRLEAGLRGLLGALTSTPYSPTQHLEREQALAKQFAEILHFTLRFDELKMTNPAIQNDFSYYRRTLSRMRINNVPAEGENEVNNELANRMSLFYAEATPMLKTLSDATTKFVSENKNLPIENTTDCLSTMASVCRVMLETPEYRSRFTNEETVSFCLRVMVGVIILYDHVHPVGAFAKTSKIDMKGCIKVLKDQPPNSVEGLLNALRYTTKHLNDETTSKQIKSMLQ
ncbi:Fam49b [Columba guinea]|nr:Fam49b [Columba guinea]